MKKCSSILLIAVFALLQTNRWTAYMSCQLKNQYSAVSCDCERILAASTDAPADHPLAHAHWPPDDFFYPVQMADVSPASVHTVYQQPPVARRLTGFPPGNHRPPVA